MNAGTKGGLPRALALLALVVVAGCGGAAGGLRPAGPPQPGELRVVSFNVARDFGLNRGALTQTLVGTPRALLAHPELAGAHVVALQEVCSRGGRAPVSRWLWRLGRRRWRARFDRNDPERPGACGEGQLWATTLPVQQSDAQLLPRVRTASRVAQRVDLTWADRPVRVWHVHLNGKARRGDPAAARLRQLRPVLDAARAFRRRHPRGVAVVLGDLNTRSADEPAVRALRGVLRSAVPPGHATHVLGWPLDWIWVRGASVRRWAVVPVKGSDHHAVVATLQLAPADEP